MEHPEVRRFTPLFQRNDVNTRLPSLNSRFAANMNVDTCPLVLFSTDFKPIVDEHYNYVMACLPCPIRIIPLMGETSQHATLNDISGNFTQFKVNYQGKSDYTRIASLVRDMHFMSHPEDCNSFISTTQEFRYRRTQIEVFLPPISQITTIGRTEYRFFDTDFTNGGWFNFTQFIPSYLMVSVSASHFAQERLISLVDELPETYVKEWDLKNLANKFTQYNVEDLNE